MNDEPSTSVDDEALSWLIRKNSGEMSRSERRNFAAWIQASRAHRNAYAEAERLWNDAGHLSQDPLSGRIRAAPNRAEGFAHKRIVSFAIAAAFSLGVFVVFAFGLHWRLLADRVSGIEPQVWTLPDGSRLYLDADTALSIDFSGPERRVMLHRGACWFKVMPDVGRPFRVVSDNLRVTALGTEFLVDIRADEPYVAVTEHAVEVAREGRRLRIEQGEGLRVAQDAASWQAEFPSAKTLGGFRQGRLIVENRPLGEVIAALSRYRHGILVVRGEALSGERISGVFDLHHPEKALDALTQILPIELVRVSPFLVVITEA